MTDKALEDELPPDPVSGLATEAHGVMHVVEEYVAAGFTRQEAVTIVAAMVSGLAVTGHFDPEANGA